MERRVWGLQREFGGGSANMSNLSKSFKMHINPRLLKYNEIFILLLVLTFLNHLKKCFFNI